MAPKLFGILTLIAAVVVALQAMVLNLAGDAAFASPQNAGSGDRGAIRLTVQKDGQPSTTGNRN